MTLPRFARWAAAVGVVAALLTGCGDDRAPGESVPALARQLDAVDAAVAAHDLGRARAAVTRLVDLTARARADGRLSDDRADEIEQAAERVLDRLPADDASPSPIPSPDVPSDTASTRPTEAAEGDGAPEEKPGHGKPHHDKGHEKKPGHHKH